MLYSDILYTMNLTPFMSFVLRIAGIRYIGSSPVLCPCFSKKSAHIQEINGDWERVPTVFFKVFFLLSSCYICVRFKKIKRVPFEMHWKGLLLQTIFPYVWSRTIEWGDK